MSTKHEGDAGLSSPFAPHPSGSVQIHMQRPTGYTVGADHTAALRHARKLAAGAAENAAWIAAHGEIGVDEHGRKLELDHLCRRRNCVALHHLEPVTRAENERRKSWAYRCRRKLCARGHELASALVTPEGIALDLMVAFNLGLASQVHCVGMCGGIVGAFSVATPHRPFPVPVLTQQSWFSEAAAGGLRVLAFNAGGGALYLFDNAKASRTTQLLLSADKPRDIWDEHELLFKLVASGDGAQAEQAARKHLEEAKAALDELLEPGT